MVPVPLAFVTLSTLVRRAYGDLECRCTSITAVEAGTNGELQISRPLRLDSCLQTTLRATTVYSDNLVALIEIA